MILTTKQDFENAILHGEEIKTQTIFYTGELVKGKDMLNIGDYDKDKGIFAGYLHGKQVWVGMNDEPEQMTWDEAMNLEKSGRHVPTIDELTLAYLHKDEINQALIKHGGEAFKEDDYYWSSSEFGNDYSWVLYMGSGFRSNFNENDKVLRALFPAFVKLL